MPIWFLFLPRPGVEKITSNLSVHRETDLAHEKLAEEKRGIWFALAAYSFWGVAPIYFVWVGFAQPLEILSYRIICSIPLLALLITMGGSWPVLRQLNRKALYYLAFCSILLASNWLIFIYAILDGRIAETALGYYINPIVSILLGWMFLQERMRPLQWLAAMLAAIGVGYELVVQGELPLLGLVLAFSFGLYGLVRKVLQADVQVPAALALGIETAFVFPLALGYLIYAFAAGVIPARGLEANLLLTLGGLVTVIPLVCFGAAAQRLPLTKLGFFQYIAPSISLLIAVLLYQEEVSDARWVNLSLIWIGLVLYSGESLYVHRRTSPK